MRRPTFASVIRLTVVGVAGIESSSGSSSVICSKLKSPVRRWPKSSICRPVTATFRYGPAGSESVWVAPPTRKSSSTTTGKVLEPTVRRIELIATSTTSADAEMSVDRRMLAVAVMRPAMPSGVIRKSAVPPEIRTPTSSASSSVPWSSPRNSSTSVAATLTTLRSSEVFSVPSGPALVTCSKANEPLSDWPRTTIGSSASTVISTRRYGPAGSTSGNVSSPTLNSSSTAAVVVLICSETPIAGIEIESPRSPTSSTSALIWPATPAGVIRNWPSPAETSRPVSSPSSSEVPLSSPMKISTFAAASRMTRTSSTVPIVPSAPGVRLCSNAKSPLRRWPKTFSSTSTAPIRR
jgi:hypothetical protein